MTDLEAKIYIAQVRTFYQDLLWYGIVNFVLMLIWLFFSSTWYFWPGWLMLGCGLVLTRRAVKLDLVSFEKLKNWIPVFKSDWEEKQLKKLTRVADETTQKVKKSVEDIEKEERL